MDCVYTEFRMYTEFLRVYGILHDFRLKMQMQI